MMSSDSFRGDDDDDDQQVTTEHHQQQVSYSEPTMVALPPAKSTPPKGSSTTTTPTRSSSSTSTTSATAAAAGDQAKRVLGQLTLSSKSALSSTNKAFSNVFSNSPMKGLMQKKYALPDKTVASQVLMYRQLLHTKCRPALRLSRPYHATPAQQAVKHMPWWEQGIEESKRMVISYDNLIVRLWMNGAIMPFQQDDGVLDTLLNEEGLPPVPHPHWVDRLGFQQPDPVTDFRSGGVLSLAMMVYMVESHPSICARFHDGGGDVGVLPFGITCINVTMMISKFLMLAKSTDRMDALLSHKPFWRMFADPNAITAVQELSMSMLCDVVVELKRDREMEAQLEQMKKVQQQEQQQPSSSSSSNTHTEEVTDHHDDGGTKLVPTSPPPSMPTEVVQARPVTVFDFSQVLETTERRVRDDLLGTGPKTVDELRQIHKTLVQRYQHQQAERHSKQMAALERKRRDRRQQQQQQQQGPGGGGVGGSLAASMTGTTRSSSLLKTSSMSMSGALGRMTSSSYNNNNKFADSTTSPTTPTAAAAAAGTTKDNKNNTSLSVEKARDLLGGAAAASSGLFTKLSKSTTNVMASATSAAAAAAATAATATSSNQEEDGGATTTTSSYIPSLFKRSTPTTTTTTTTTTAAPPSPPDLLDNANPSPTIVSLPEPSVTTTTATTVKPVTKTTETTIAAAPAAGGTDSDPTDFLDDLLDDDDVDADGLLSSGDGDWSELDDMVEGVGNFSIGDDIDL